jgi:hypothetical protein
MPEHQKATQKARRPEHGGAEEERRGAVGEPHLVRQQILKRVPVERGLKQRVREHVADVIKVLALAHRKVHEGVVQSHHQQQTVKHPLQRLFAVLMITKARGRPRGQRHGDLSATLHT